MPTLMTQPTFGELEAVRQEVAEETEKGIIGPANVFVPWAGEMLVSQSRGIYYVGIAINAEAGEGKQSFEAELQSTEAFCEKLPLGHTPFWAFLNDLQ